MRGAQRHAGAALRVGDDVSRADARLTLAELSAAMGDTDEALLAYKEVLDTGDENLQVRAELGIVRMELEAGTMTPLQANDRLDTLRFRWRGDALELEIVAALAETQYALGRYRDSLNTAQDFAKQFPDLPGSRELRIDLTDRFEDLFLAGMADSLDPISSLALFYEFRDLTPIGPDGDRMIRKLASRLVAFDLLDPASELLSHQVENRNLIGSNKAAIAADLASIYLMDRRAEDALRALNETRTVGMEDDLRRERRILEAAAHMQLGRYDHSIELLETMSSQAAADLLAEVQWRSRDWAAAAQTLERDLPGQASSLAPDDEERIIRTAIALRMGSDTAGLARLRRTFATRMTQSQQNATFEMLTGADDISGARLTELVRRLSDTTAANNFVAGLKQRFQTAES